MKAHYYEIASGEIVLAQNLHDPVAAAASGYGDPSTYGVLFCSSPDDMEYVDGQWHAKMTFAELKAAKLAEIKAEYELERTVRNKGIRSEALGVMIDCRERDITNIEGVIKLYELTGEEPTFYRTKDNKEIAAGISEFCSVLGELLRAQIAMWQKKDLLDKKVAAATTAEQIKAVTWDW